MMDRDIDDVVLQLGTPGDLAGRWRVDESRTPKSAEQKTREAQGSFSIDLSPVEFTGSVPRPARAKADGTFEFKGVPPGEYRVGVSAAFGTYVRSLRFEGQEVVNRIVRVGLGGGQLEIVFGRDGGMVKGVVRDDKGQPVKGVRVAMWDARVKAGETVPYYEQGAATSAGEFSFGSLPPGEYRIAAWMAADPKVVSSMESPEFLLQFNGQATAVKVGPDSEQSVDVKTVGKEAIDKALEKLP